MANKLTEIIFIIDNSGSMYPLIFDTIGGFNGFVKKQREQDGEALLTTVLFNSTHKKLHDRIDILEIEDMTTDQYKTGGATALLDAIGDTIESVQSRIDETPVLKRPDGVICVIITDGEENSSVSFKKAQIKKMIEHQQKGHGWEFIFLGASMEAVQDARSYGIASVNTVTYTADSIGTVTAYNCIDKAVASYRDAGIVDCLWSTDLTGADTCTTVSATKLVQ